jgi:hypothetical protein
VAHLGTGALRSKKNMFRTIPDEAANLFLLFHFFALIGGAKVGK